MNEEKVFFTPYEIAAMYSISYQSALEWIKTSGINFVKIGRLYRVRVEEFNKFIESHNKS